MNKESIVPESPCPYCKRVLDRTTNARDNDHVPTPGAIAVCICCGGIAEYNDKLLLEKLAPGKLNKIKSEDFQAYSVIKRAQNFIRQKKKEGDWIK